MKSMSLKSESEKSGAENFPLWYAIYTNPRQEDRAYENLKAWQVETFFPKIEERRYSVYTGKPSFVAKPLFPRYIFARFRASELLQKVCFTRGVNSVVSFGDGPPVPVDDEVIAFIQSQRQEDGLIRPSESLKPGDKVVINDGPFKDLVGIFEQETTVARRISVLLATVCYQGRLIVEKDFVRKVNEPV